MATLICFHAHPDDEAITTGGTMARAAAEGHRVVLVVATRGEHGEVRPGVVADGVPLGLHRITETLASASILGATRVEFLGYVDSGMVDTSTVGAPYSFAGADLDSAARRLLAIVDSESEPVLTIYDHHGNYGHPDHVAVHRVGARAAALRPELPVFEATMNRDAIIAMIQAGRENPELVPDDAPDPAEVQGLGMPADSITHAVDVTAHLGAKRAALRAHASQISESDFFLRMDDDTFAASFGTEWFIRHGWTRARGEPMADRILG